MVSDVMGISVTLKMIKLLDFPGGPVVKTPYFQCRGCRFDPAVIELSSGHRTEISYAMQYGQKEIFLITLIKVWPFIVFEISRK